MSYKKNNLHRLNTFQTPHPKLWLINLMTHINRIVMFKGIPILRNLPLFRNIPVIRGLCDIRYIDFPDSDKQKLIQVMQSQNACFITPNHPELFTDWMLDKEISAQTFPLMAHWATHDIVNGMGKTMQNFWLNNNLIAQIPAHTEKAVTYSIQTAQSGTPVLLHPEGSVAWQADQIRHLYSGAAKMVLKIVQENSHQPVYIIPIVWKLIFDRDEQKALHHEINLIEKRMNLPSSHTFSLTDRVKLVYENILQQRSQLFQCGIKRHGTYFQQQDDYLNQLVNKLSNIVSCPQYDTAEQRAHHCLDLLRNHIKSGHELNRTQQKIQKEIQRVLRTPASVYYQDIWQQEHIAENLKRIRCDLMKQTLSDRIHQIIPQPVGPRSAYIRVADIINVQAIYQNNPEITEDELMLLLKSRLSEHLKLLIEHLDIKQQNKPIFKNPFLIEL